MYTKYASLWIGTPGGSDYPIFEGSEEINKQIDAIVQNLKDLGLYEYKYPGSVFNDFKIGFGKYLYKIGKEKGINDLTQAIKRGDSITAVRFGPGMTTNQALNKAREIVNNWDWE